MLLTTMTCDTPLSPPSIFLRSTPTVQNMMAPYGRGSTDSNLTLYPVDWPSCSARSVDTRSATETALIRRGCVHTMLQCAPEPLLTHSSRMYWHTCVVLPQRHGVLVDGLQDLSAEGEYRQLLALLGGGLQLGVSLLALGPVCFEVPKEALTLNTFVPLYVKCKIGL